MALRAGCDSGALRSPASMFRAKYGGSGGAASFAVFPAKRAARERKR